MSEQARARLLTLLITQNMGSQRPYEWFAVYWDAGEGALHCSQHTNYDKLDESMLRRNNRLAGPDLQNIAALLSGMPQDPLWWNFDLIKEPTKEARLLIAAALLQQGG